MPKSSDVRTRPVREEGLPQAIDHDPRRQRIGGIDRASQSEAIGGGAFRETGQSGWRRRGHRVAVAVVHAADEDVGGARFLEFGHDQGDRDGQLRVRICFFNWVTRWLRRS